MILCAHKRERSVHMFGNGGNMSRGEERRGKVTKKLCVLYFNYLKDFNQRNFFRLFFFFEFYNLSFFKFKFNICKSNVFMNIA